jgi:polyisoprenoid-binding protein YceI
MNKFLLIVFFGLYSLSIQAQRYTTSSGYIGIFAETTIETIEAHNRKVGSKLDLSTGAFSFFVNINSFEFENKGMKEEFFEKYIESDIYPEARFEGTILNIEGLDLGQGSTLDATIEGKLTIHGVTRDVFEKGTLLMLEYGGIVGESVIVINPADYNISIPMDMVDVIPDEIKLTVEVRLMKLKR